jgi:hypothetical protein
MRNPAAPLTAREHAFIDFERDWAVQEGRKDAEIRRRFGITPARYYQILGRLLDRPEAAGYDPLTVKRLRRRRDARRRRRTAERLGTTPR